MEISVIMPVYKVEKYLRQAVDSVLAQTFKDFELIIVDDGSPDNCPTICDEYAKKDARIKVIHKKNGGLSSARNAGMDVAKGKWIAFIDSDDMYKRDMLMKMWARGEQDSEIDYVHCGAEIVPDENCSVSKSDIEYCAQTFDDVRVLTDEIILASNVYVWNKLFRADIIRSYRLRFPEGLCFEDLFFYTAFAVSSRKVGFVSDNLYVYNRRSGSITARLLDGDASYVNDYILVWRKLVDFLRQVGKLREKSHMVFRLLTVCAGDVNAFAPETVSFDKAKDFLSYANINPRDFSFSEKADMFWWRHGKPGGGSIKYLGGLFKLQLRARKIIIRFLGIKIFSINLMSCE